MKYGKEVVENKIDGNFYDWSIDVEEEEEIPHRYW